MQNLERRARVDVLKHLQVRYYAVFLWPPLSKFSLEDINHINLIYPLFYNSANKPDTSTARM